MKIPMNKFVKVRLITAVKKYERVRAYYLNPKLCAYCSAPIAYERRMKTYCNRSCAFSQIKCKPLKMEFRQCLVCKKDLEGGHRLKVWYCSQEHYQQHRWTKIVEVAERTGKFYDARTAKKYLLQKRPHQCEACKRKTWLGDPIALTIHHVNGDPTDHRIKNLQLLCHLCHANTDTYTGKKHRLKFQKHGKKAA